MYKAPLVSVICMLVASVFGAVGQYLYKNGSEHAASGSFGYLLSPWILSGMGSYIAVMFLFTQAFRAGGSVTVLYPIYASTFIWAAVIGMLVYGQPIRPIHLVGMALLVLGMFLMGVGNAPAT